MTRFDRELVATVAAVVEEGAFDAAARRLRLTPSAVSQRVKLLEEQLGRVLIVRSRPVQATEAGEAILRLARQSALLEDDAAEALGLNGEDGRRASITLAVDADSTATWLLAPLVRCANQSAINLELIRADPAETSGLLGSGRVMAIVTSDTAPVPGCTSSWLGSLRYIAVAAPDFIGTWFRDGVTPDALAHAPNVSFDRQDDLQREWLSAVGAEQSQAPRHFVPSTHDLLRAVELGLAWAMVPSLQAAGSLAVGAVRPLGLRPLHVPLYWQQWSLRSRILDALRTAVSTTAREVLVQPLDR